MYSGKYYFQDSGFKLINKDTFDALKKFENATVDMIFADPPPNLACKTFTHSTETILWAKKDLSKVKYTFNYHDMKELNSGK